MAPVLYIRARIGLGGYQASRTKLLIEGSD